MNIFALDESTRAAARAHCDKHVVKMPLETAQLLCTAQQVLDGPKPGLYKPTHLNHPCSIWVRSCAGNYIWTYMLFRDLAAEYKHRYGKNHLSWTKLQEPLRYLPDNICCGERQPFALAMPDIYAYTSDDPVEAYRNYYIGAKQHLHAWRNRPRPEWLNGG